MYSFVKSGIGGNDFPGAVQQSPYATSSGLNMFSELNQGSSSASSDGWTGSVSSDLISGNVNGDLDKRAFSRIADVTEPARVNSEMECEDLEGSNVGRDCDPNASPSPYFFGDTSKAFPVGDSTERVYSRAKRQLFTKVEVGSGRFNENTLSSVQGSIEIKSTPKPPVAPSMSSVKLATKRDACGHVVFNEDWGYIPGLDYGARDNGDTRTPKCVRK